MRLLERKVTKERISIGAGNEMTTIEYSCQDVKESEESYVVLRAKFDKWLAEEAEKRLRASFQWVVTELSRKVKAESPRCRCSLSQMNEV